MQQSNHVGFQLKTFKQLDLRTSDSHRVRTHGMPGRQVRRPQAPMHPVRSRGIQVRAPTGKAPSSRCVGTEPQPGLRGAKKAAPGGTQAAQRINTASHTRCLPPHESSAVASSRRPDAVPLTPELASAAWAPGEDASRGEGMKDPPARATLQIHSGL